MYLHIGYQHSMLLSVIHAIAIGILEIYYWEAKTMNTPYSVHLQKIIYR